MRIPDHDPRWCRGSMADKCTPDDPCWRCIAWAFERVDDLEDVLLSFGIEVDLREDENA